MDILTVEEIKRVEERENQIGTRFIRLMENAGAACARRIMKHANDYFYHMDEKPSVCVVCGAGKNGGDGFVIARKLCEEGFPVSVVLMPGAPKAEDAIEMYSKAYDLGIKFYTYDGTSSESSLSAEHEIDSADILVDCIFGFGFHGEPDVIAGSMFHLVNTSPALVFAVDVPSGINANNGEAGGEHVVADITLAITSLKPGHVYGEGKRSSGEIEIVDIGMSDEAFEGCNPKFFSVDDTEDGMLLPYRDDDAHKNDFGHVLFICGSRNMPGAGKLSSSAAVYTGAGLVTVAFPESAYPAFASGMSEIMLCPLPETEDGKLSTSAVPELSSLMKKASVIVLGCGLGQGDEVDEVVAFVIRNASCPLVLDADGLNSVSKNMEVLKDALSSVIVTPHPGEMKRLLGKDISDSLYERIEDMKALANEYNLTVLLKGPTTLVVTKNNEKIYMNRTGNSGLAKGGSGDVLSGIIGGLLAQSLESFSAAYMGAYMHGLAADVVAKKYSKNGMVASDIFEGIRFIYKENDL